MRLEGEAPIMASWFETREDALLTMRVESVLRPYCTAADRPTGAGGRGGPGARGGGAWRGGDELPKPPKKLPSGLVCCGGFFGA
jgi:hypothetical protein